jgi:CheY-like chemotaxis protein
VQKRRILIVDDNQAALRMLGILVEMLGHEVQLAHNGEEALEVAASFQPEIIFLDLGMPLMNGYEVAQRLRERPWGKKVKLVALTGWGEAEDRRRTQEAGFDHHLIKPADKAALEEVLGQDGTAGAS